MKINLNKTNCLASGFLLVIIIIFESFLFINVELEEEQFRFIPRKRLTDLVDKSLKKSTNYFNTTLEEKGVILLATEGLGIGNQLYKYACSYALARDSDRPLYIFVPTQNLTSLRRQFLPKWRAFALDKFKIPMVNLIDKSTSINPGSISYVNDSQLLFRNYPDKPFLLVSSNCQSQSYWASYKEDILNMFQLRPEVEKEFSPFVLLDDDDIERGENSVCVHVRRGDFTTNAGHYQLPISYQKWAIHHMKELLQRQRHTDRNYVSPSPQPTFFVFSDDIDYVKQELEDIAKIDKIVFVSSSSSKKTSSLEDFFLMTKCKHFIIPNSTFAWWAAFLSMERRRRNNNGPSFNQDGIVIASESPPEYWKQRHGNQDELAFYKVLHAYAYYPQNWIIYHPPSKDGATTFITD